MPDAARKGRAVLIAVVVISLGVSAVSVALQTWTNGASIMPFVRFALTAVLSIYLLRGSLVAKWIYVVLGGLGGIGELLFRVFVPMAATAGAILTAMGLGYLLCAVALIWSKSVRAFMEYKAGGV